MSSTICCELTIGPSILTTPIWFSPRPPCPILPKSRIANTKNTAKRPPNTINSVQRPRLLLFCGGCGAIGFGRGLGDCGVEAIRLPCRSGPKKAHLLVHAAPQDNPGDTHSTSKCLRVGSATLGTWSPHLRDRVVLRAWRPA